MRVITLVILIVLDTSIKAQVVDAVRFIDTNRLFGKVTCKELKEKRSFLHQQYLVHRDQAWELAAEKSKEGYPCFWYDVELENYDLLFNDNIVYENCNFGQAGCTYYYYYLEFKIIKKPRQPLMTGVSSGYTICDQEILRNFPTR